MLGLEFRCQSKEYYLLCKTHVVTPKDVIMPPEVVDLISPGGACRGVLRVTESNKLPGKRLIVQPILVVSGSLPYVLIELGATKLIEGFGAISATCVEMRTF